MTSIFKFALSVAKVAEVAGFSGVWGSDLIIFLLELSVAEVAKGMFRKNNKFTLVFDLSVAEVAEVAGFSGVPGVGFDNIWAWIVGSKSSKMHVS